MAACARRRGRAFGKDWPRLTGHLASTAGGPARCAAGMKTETSLDIRSVVAQVARVLQERGTQAYAVGGYVRDLLLDRGPRDVDIAVSGDSPLVAARAVADALGGSFFALDLERGYARVLVPHPVDGGAIILDFTPLQGTLEEDLARRDFTLDAMALPISSAHELRQLIDPHGGRYDIEQRLVRTMSEDVLREDPLRLLRAVRLAGEMELSIEENTAALIKAHAGAIQEVSPERVRDEVCRVLDLPRAGPWLWEMDRLGLLTQVFPEIAPARGVEQPKEHYWDV
ncbi:MAG: CCA tRNA nucleotidyltransferase, partial [SAR202 cluster bacterium]|nr:CCA tRNA nucleotidyltransferase [SAR202 cluster bacterium]